MIIRRKDGLVFYEFEIFKEAGIKHGIFSRHGGVSPDPWNSLNIGSTVGDKQSNIIENRKRIFDVIGREVESLFDVWQVHGLDVAIADKPRPLDSPHTKADILLTDNPDVTLLGRFADCVPILLYDYKKKVIGIAHAGWKGTVNKIALEAVKAMETKFGSNPGNILAGVGPSIGPDEYEVGEGVINAVKNMPNYENADFLKKRNGKVYLDLWRLNHQVLLEAKVKNIEIAEICTATDTYNWFSHRKENGKTGRFGAVIAL